MFVFLRHGKQERCRSDCLKKLQLNLLHVWIKMTKSECRPTCNGHMMHCYGNLLLFIDTKGYSVTSLTIYLLRFVPYK